MYLNGRTETSPRMASIRIVNSIFSQNRLQILNSSRMVENVIKRYKYDKHDKHEKYKKDNKLSTSIRNEVDTNVKPLGEKVKETTKTASYMGVILLGVGVTGALFYAVFRELFSSKSPNNVYAKALKRCLEDTRVEDKLGYPITGFGEESRRRRRQHVSHVLYNRDGKQHLRMKFYLKGSVHKGTVQLEMVEVNRLKI